MSNALVPMAPVQQFDLATIAKQANVLGPVGLVSAAEGMQVALKVIQLSANPDDKDVYPAISGAGVSLGKNGLFKISSAMGIQWHPTLCGLVYDGPPCSECAAKIAKGELNRCIHNVGYRAVGAWMDSNGDWQVTVCTKYWQADEEYAEVHRVYERQAHRAKNPIPESQIEPKTSEEFAKRFRDRFSLIETKAKLRVVREAAYIKPSYREEELSRPFVAIRYQSALSAEERQRRGERARDMLFDGGAQPAALPAGTWDHAHDVSETLPPQLEGQPAPESASDEEFPDVFAPAEPTAPEPPKPAEPVCEEPGCGVIISPRDVELFASERGKQQFGGHLWCSAHRAGHDLRKRGA